MDSTFHSRSDQTMVLYAKQALPNTVATMEELLNSPPITLTIGPDKCQTTVQSILFRGMSGPLHQLLNSPQALNGDTTDINEVLQRDDKVAFRQLVKSAYSIIVRGKGSLPLVESANELSKAQTSLAKARCPTCKKKRMQLVYACLSCNPDLTKNDDDAVGLSTFLLIQFLQTIENSLAQVPYLADADTIPQMAIDLQDPVSAKPYPLLHFAHVYTLASKYKMYPVKIAALKSFLRRLKKVQTTFDENEAASMTELIDALRFISSGPFREVFVLNGTTAISHPSLTGPSEFAEILISAPHENMSGKFSHSTPSHARTPARGPDLLTILVRCMLIRLDDLLDYAEFRELIAENGSLGLIVMEILREGMNLS